MKGKMVKPSLYYTEGSPAGEAQVEVNFVEKPLRKVNFFVLIPIIVCFLLFLALALTASGTGTRHIQREESLRDLADLLTVEEAGEAEREEDRNFWDKVKNTFVSGYDEVHKHVFRPIAEFFGKDFDVRVEHVLLRVFESIGIPEEEVTYPLLADSLSMAYDDLAVEKGIEGYGKLVITDVELERALMNRKTDIHVIYSKQAGLPEWQSMYQSTFRVRYFVFVSELLMFFTSCYLIFCRLCIGASSRSPDLTSRISRVVDSVRVETWETIEFTMITSIATFGFICACIEGWFASGNAVGWTSPCWTGAAITLFIVCILSLVDLVYHYRLYRSRV